MTDLRAPSQFGGAPIKVGEDEYTLFRDHEYVSPSPLLSAWVAPPDHHRLLYRLLAKINE